MALKAAMKKGQPHFKKRLFGNLFNQLLVTENGIKVFYELEEQSNLNGSERQKKKPSDSKSDGISIFTKSLFLVSNGSPVVTVGGGVSNRTQVVLYTIFSKNDHAPFLGMGFRDETHYI